MSPARFAHYTRVILVGVLIVALGAACGGTTPQTQATDRPEQTTIRIGTIPASSAGPLVIAQQRGLFKQEGLDVKLQMFTGGVSAITELQRGRIDLAISSYPSLFQAQEKGQNIRIISEIDLAPDNHFQIVVGNKSKIREPADLKGKTIAVNQRRNIAELSCLITLRIYGMNARRDRIKFVEWPFPDLPRALQKGAVDAAWVFDPWLTLAEQQGARSVAQAMSGPLADFPMTSYAATDEYTKKNPRTVAAFKRAIVKAQRIAQEDRNATDVAVSKLLRQNPHFISTLVLSDYVTSTNAVRLQRVSDFMLEFGYLKTKVDAQSLIF